MVSLSFEIQGLSEYQEYLKKLEKKLDTVIADALMDMRSTLLQRFRSRLPRMSGAMQTSARIERRGNAVALIAVTYYRQQGSKIPSSTAASGGRVQIMTLLEPTISNRHAPTVS